MPQTASLTPVNPQPQVAPVATATPQPLAAQTSQPPSGPSIPAGLDPVAYTLTKAIAYQENGGSAPNYNAASGDGGATPDGSTGKLGGGAYQFIPQTWENYAQQVLGSANAPMTPENQNQVAYTKVADWLKQGYTYAQVASMWNAGEGAPNAYQANVGTNAAGANYNTPKYAENVQKYAEQLWNGQTPTPYQAPSLGGFVQNAVSSAGNFAGNIGNAVAHPISTIGNLGSALIGTGENIAQGLTGENKGTDQFQQVADNIGQYFKSRYGSVSDIEHSLYTDPVGVLADISAALGVGGGVAGAVGKAGELSTAASATDAADAALSSGVRTMAGDTAIGNSLTRGASAVQEALGSASNAVNPITPVIAGASKLIGASSPLIESAASSALSMPRSAIQTILNSPGEFTADDIANASRSDLGEEIGTALNNKIDDLSETGTGYAPYKETPTPVKGSSNWLENQLRTVGKLDVTDGEISANSSSVVRDTAGVNELQRILNQYKPDFQSGTMDSQKLLNLREDLAGTADYQKSLTKNVQEVARSIRSNLNKDFRPQVPGLAERDASFASQVKELTALRKGLIDKNGNLLESATNKIANAAGAGKDDLLARLEKIVPGITHRIEIQKAMEAISKAKESRVGTYTKSIVEGGAGIVGLSTGNIPLVAGALATAIITHPSIALPIIRVFGENKALMAAITAKLAKAVTLPTVLNSASQPSAEAGTPEPTAQSPAGTM